MRKSLIDGVLGAQQKRADKSVYVVIANEGEQVKECIVLSELIVAQDKFEMLKEIWGGANVALICTQVDTIPVNLMAYAPCPSCGKMTKQREGRDDDFCLKCWGELHGENP